MNRYEVDSSETQFQKGSNDLVLLNDLGITSLEEMDDIEAILLTKLYEKVFRIENTELTSFSFLDIATWHRQWLGNIYQWAGKIRQVDMSKGGFRFATPQHIERNLIIFERDFLSKIQHLPNLDHEELVSYLARSHIEFILIHPFREGNGRISRLLLDFMSNKAGVGLLDYSLWDENKAFYIRSIQAGVAKDYQHMERLVRDILN
ncbi:hypothetical protein MED121_14614 [Marinomonas sp. MED121]|uniref:Fic/DOC family protein n=1 Tax=Marinomonas sp. MED121 TaxID=314277 RepID=UPI0000691229|nr:Fic family protein [Marinomonas sp. MED121]EAQ67168.1 hypothetical protein MED121_14614 [Marinomonas sp. MED121]